MASPSDPIWVLCIGTPYQTLTPQCDPAIDTSHPECSHALVRYSRSRSVADRDAIPLRPDTKPVLWQVKPLTPGHLRFVDAADGPVEKYQRAFLCGCHAIQVAGVERTAKVTVSGKIEIADDSWLDEIFAEFGQDRIDEIGAVALQRAKAGPKATDPFGLPPGLRLRP